MFTMTRLATFSVVSATIQHLSPFYYLWVPDKLGYLYSPTLDDERFFRILNDLGNDFRSANETWLGFLFSRQAINNLSGRRHEGVVHTRSERLSRGLSDDLKFRFRTQVRTPIQLKFYSNDAFVIERLEEHFIVGPFKKDLLMQLDIEGETYDIAFRMGLGGEDSDVEIGAFERDPYGLVSTLTRTLYATYPIIWLPSDRDGQLMDTDPETGAAIREKVIKNIHVRVLYQDTGELVYEEVMTSS